VRGADNSGVSLVIQITIRSGQILKDIGIKVPEEDGDVLTGISFEAVIQTESYI